MKKGLIFGAGFLMGGAAGATGVWFLLKQTLEQKAEEEIACVRNAFLEEEKRRRETEKGNPNKEEEKPSASKAADALRKYSGTEEAAPEREPDKKAEAKRPYPITPMKFAETTKEFGDTTLKYYPDANVMTSAENNYPLSEEEIEERVGKEAVLFFGQEGQEEDCVHIRNEVMHTDFEILQMGGSYMEIVNKDPALKRYLTEKGMLGTRTAAG